MPRLPAEPCKREKEEHEASGYAAYRSLCVHCVAAKGRSLPPLGGEAGEIPEIGMDYGYLAWAESERARRLCW